MSRYSKDQERRIARVFREAGFKASRVPLSGSLEGYKGDVLAEKGFLKFLIEHEKARAKKITHLRRCELEKIARFAREEGRIPLLTLSFKSSPFLPT